MNQQTTKTRLNREQSQALTRERLLQAGRKLFVQNGFGGASIREIAEAAGYSQGAFYSNFVDKDAILLELLRAHMETEAAQLAAVFASAELSGEEVLAALDAWADTLHADANWTMLSIELQLHASRSPAFAAAYEAVWKTHRSALGHVIERLFAHLALVPPAEPEQLAAGFMALAHGLGLQGTAVHPAPAGKMIMLFLRGLIAAAETAVK
ncbi:TetR/AcrR family transcriptional regulator [Collimonas sp.]|uniref:TetR/AcrR family transcriptional regulator n=1 Tax=Collimonas sp. TaxID=1963772 RepID=UPI002C88F0BC|nr:TetR/AcrR family transcriptional regulator [Collimonas sp.]HWW05348.1 TetR/AcrR family transcriptional regulator [Collimonas sp.]